MVTVRIIFFVVCVAVIIFGASKHVRRKMRMTDDNQQEHDEIVDTDKKGKDELKYILDSINSWINNCDQKAGMLLAIIGVAITVMLTSDFVKFIRDYIFIPFVGFLEGPGEYIFSWGRFTVFFLMVVASIFLMVSIYYLFKSIGANINYTKMCKESPDLVKKSYIFFGSISDMKFEDFDKDKVNFEEDLKSQIYINSKIATTKFQNYNEGLSWFKFLLLVVGMLFVAVMVMQ